MFWRYFIFFVLAVAIELYFLQAVKTFTQDFTPNKKNIIYWIAYGLAILSVLIGAISLFYPPPEWNGFFRFVSAMVFILLLCKFLGIIFLLVDDILRVFRWLYKVIFVKAQAAGTEGGITRLKFLSQVAVAFTVVPAISFLYGMVRGAYKYRIHNVKVKSPNLPEAFNGYKIVQISDMHTGSFFSTEPLSKAFKIVMEQNADLILFTGDLVNNTSEETKDFLEVYRMLKAPHGVYSVLGNHDYGDYVTWESAEAKEANLEALKKVHADSGWNLLMNQHVSLEVKGEKIALIGIENWGGNLHFPRYGKLDVAYSGAENYPFKILMSHDPSHWDKQVRTEYPNIDLTLSGHTHGMQLGIEIPGLKWSPVQYFYKQWAGLYKQENQYLYVNRGIGFLGYPGRLGIWPEITVIELQKG